MTGRLPLHPTPREIVFPVASQGLEGVFVAVVSRGSGVNVKVEHRLRRVPFGAIPITNQGTVLYDPAGAASPTRLEPWTTEEAIFQPQTAAGTKHLFLVF